MKREAYLVKPEQYKREAYLVKSAQPAFWLILKKMEIPPARQHTAKTKIKPKLGIKNSTASNIPQRIISIIAITA